MTGKDWRRLAARVVDLAGPACSNVLVRASDGADFLPYLGDLRLDVDEQLAPVELSQLTTRALRKAFWSMRTRPEWGDDAAAVWHVSLAPVYYVGLGILRPMESPRPVAVPVLSIGGDDGRTSTRIAPGTVAAAGTTAA